MAEFLTTEWVDQVEPLFAGIGERVQAIVTGGPHGEVRLGEADEPDLVLTTTSEVAREMLDGTLDVNVAYMQGRLKTAGDTGVLFRLLSKARKPAFTEHRHQLQSLTD